MTSLAQPARIRSSTWLDDQLQQPSAPASILCVTNMAAFQAPGGGETQLLKTVEPLGSLGYPIRPFCPWRDRIAEARLIHLFGMSREGLSLARVARSRRVPVVLSPITWFDRASWGNIARAGLRRLRLRAPDWRRELLDLADAILPNSTAEADQLRALFDVGDRITVVPNGVDERFDVAGESTERTTVLYVGRVEPRKNVLGLIRSLQGTGLPLTIAGGVVPGHEAYGEACRRAGEWVDWRGSIDHDDPALIALYATARVIALPSWFETPGLVALEGALAGSAVVVTPRGAAPEYFGDRVLYARPDRPEAIRQAIVKAWEVGPDPRLVGHVRHHYLWSEVARKTAEVYDALLG